MKPLTRETRTKLFFIGWFDLFIILALLVVILFLTGGTLSSSFAFILSYIQLVHLIPAFLSAWSKFYNNKAILASLFFFGSVLLLYSFFVITVRVISLFTAITAETILLLYIDVLFLFSSFIYATSFSWMKENTNDPESTPLMESATAYGSTAIPYPNIQSARALLRKR